MRTVSASDAKQNLASVLDTAQREPVMIRRQNRDTAVVLSPVEYNRLRGLNVAELNELCRRVSERAAARGLTEKKLAKLLATDD